MTSTELNELRLAQIDREDKAAKHQVDLGLSLSRLKSNRDFNRLVIDGFMRDEAVRLVHAKADPAMQTPEAQASITRDIDAIGTLAQYLNKISIESDMAKRTLETNEGERQYLASEAL